MTYLRIDQYINVARDCPMSIDLHPADDLVEIVLGDHRTGGDTLRFVVGHPDTCQRLTEALHDARNQLVEHLRTTSW